MVQQTFLQINSFKLILRPIYVRFLESWDICQVAIDLLQLSIRELFVPLLEETTDN